MLYYGITMNDPAPFPIDPAASIVEDAALVQAIVGGDMSALETLFNKYQASVYQSAYGVTRDRDAAEEVLQDVFFRLYRFADRINGALPLAPWLYRVTINLCYNRFKGLRMWTDSFHELAERLFAPRMLGGLYTEELVRLDRYTQSAWNVTSGAGRAAIR